MYVGNWTRVPADALPGPERSAVLPARLALAVDADEIADDEAGGGGHPQEVAVHPVIGDDGALPVLGKRIVAVRSLLVGGSVVFEFNLFRIKYPFQVGAQYAYRITDRGYKISLLISGLPF